MNRKHRSPLQIRCGSGCNGHQPHFKLSPQLQVSKATSGGLHPLSASQQYNSYYAQIRLGRVQGVQRSLRVSSLVSCFQLSFRSFSRGQIHGQDMLATLLLRVQRCDYHLPMQDIFSFVAFSKSAALSLCYRELVLTKTTGAHEPRYCSTVEHNLKTGIYPRSKWPVRFDPVNWSSG
jgi:hypothetical protein